MIKAVVQTEVTPLCGLLGTDSGSNSEEDKWTPTEEFGQQQVQ